MIDNIKGISFPFFPMRPFLGTAAEDCKDLLKSKKYLIQPKLNGDRVCVVKLNDGTVQAQNRHKSNYRFNIKNLGDFAQFKKTTIFDGEVKDKIFYPFEALAVEGESLLKAPVEARVARAKEACDYLGLDWVWDLPRGYHKKGDKNWPKWEGYVLKLLGSRYTQLPNATVDSREWIKCRWRAANGTCIRHP